MIRERFSVAGDRANLATTNIPAATDLGRDKWNITSDEIISCMRSGKPVRWGLVPSPEIAGVLQRVSEEAQVPASMLSMPEFRQPFEVLGGHTLGGLYSFSMNHKERGRKGIIPFLFELTGVRATAEDVVAAMKKNRAIQWDPIPREVIKEFLETVAQEQGKTANALLARDFEKPFVALNGSNLASLYQHFAAHPDRKGKPIMIFLFENCGIEVTLYNKLRVKGKFLSKVSPDEIRELLAEAGKELGKPPSMLSSTDLDSHFKFLNGQTLRKDTRSVDGKRTKVSLHKNVDIQVTFNDVVEIARRGDRILWHRIPMEVIREILVKAADEIGISVSSILEKGIKEYRFKFLGGRSLTGLDTLIAKVKGAPSRSKTSSFLDKLGICANAADVIAKIKGERHVMWQSIRWQEIRTILDLAAEEMDIPVGMINYERILNEYAFLDGKTLERLYVWGVRHPERTPQETALMFIRRKIEIPELNLSRGAFRLKMIKESFASQNLPKQFKAEDLIAWGQSVAELYKNHFLGIEKEEVESEFMIYMLEQLAKGLSEDDLIDNLHKYLEEFLRRENRAHYKTMFLSTPIGDGDSTLQDVIASRDPKVEVEEGGSSEVIREKLKVLTPFQQNLVVAFVIDDKSFDELTGELGLDRDILEEHYADALALLRSNMEPEDEDVERTEDLVL